MPKLNGLAGDWEIWKVGSKHYVVQMVGIVDPPVPLVWEIQTQEQLRSYFGQRPVKVDHTMDTAGFAKTGALVFGVSTELSNFTDDPMDDFARTWETERKVRPWMADPEILQLSVAAYLENRQVSQAELSQTAWWQDHNAAERQWLATWYSDPASAKVQMQDNQAQVREMLTQAGMRNPPAEIVRFMAGQWTQGKWSENYIQNQITAISDPYAGIKLDNELKAVTKGTELNTTRQMEDTVRQTLQTWLGPKFGDWSEDRIQKWAGKVRNDPDAQIELEEMLRGQRAALYPEYDENLTYDEIAGPWRTMWESTWGEAADEHDPLFTRLVRSNDATEGEQTLRSEGISRGNERVKSDLLTGFLGAFGGQVRSV